MKSDLQVEKVNLDQLQKYANDLRLIYKAEKEKTRELEIFRIVFESAGIGIGLADAEGSFIQVNKTLAAILGADARDHFLDFVSPEDKKDMSDFLNRLVGDNMQRIAIEKSLITQNGKAIQTRIAINTLQFADNQAKLILVIEDITDRKRAELEVQNLSNLMIQIQEDERSRISQELHDDLGSDLFGLKLLVESAIARHSPDFKTTRQYLEIMTYLNAIMNKTRSISHTLSPIGLQEIGLCQAIEELTERYTQNGNFKVELDLGQFEDFFVNRWNTNFYRIIQEALVNVAKHSQATEVKIKAKIKGQKLQFSLQDNGVGMSEEAKHKPGLGLTLMQKRAFILGGEIHFHNLHSGLEVIIEISNE